MRKALISLFIISILLLEGACNWHPSTANTETGQPDLLPVDVSNSNSVTATIYFRYDNDNMLAGESRTISIPSDKLAETVLVEELLNGPQDETKGYRRILNRSVQLKKIEEKGDTLILSFNKALINSTPEGYPSYWASDPVLTKQVQQARVLAVYSIVNTVTEYGRYNRVQILVDAGNNQYTRVKRKDLGFAENAEQPLDALFRNGDYILTPENTIIQLFENISNNLDFAYSYISASAGTIVRPTLDDFKKTANYENLSITDNSAYGSNVSNDGKTAVVTLNFKLLTKNGEQSYQFIPVKLYRESGVWKIPYDFLYKYLFQNTK